MNKKKAKPRYSALQNLGWMVGLAWKKCKSVLLLCGALAVIGVALNLTELLIAPQILKRVEAHASVSALLLTIGGFAGLLFVLSGLKEYCNSNSLYGRISIRTAIVEKNNRKNCMTAYPNTLDTRFQKLLSSAMAATEGNDEASEHIWTTLTNLLTNLLGFAVYLFLLTHLNPILMVLVVVTAVLSFLTSRKTDAWVFQHRSEAEDYIEKLSYLRRKSESAELAKDIRIFGLAPWLLDVYRSVLKLYEGFLRRREKQKLIGHLLDVLFSVLRNGLAYYYLIQMTLRENLPASTFLLYFTALSGFTAWITGVLNECATLYKESLDINRIREFLEVPEPFRFEGGVPIPDLSGGCELRLEQVSFRYPNAEADTIHNLSLTVSPSEKLAIVGLNGAGKTTLMRLICGLLDPTSGSVKLNGVDVRELNRRDYYRQFASVFQEFSVIDCSVAENVSQQIEGIDRARVMRCLELSGLSDKIAELPNGIDTKLGRDVWEDGVLLSGGQIQRLMLVRALYRDAPILLLDEPTAALDPLAEQDVYQKYHEMTSGKTALFVSHRLASTRFCSRILLLANGGIAEEGTHDALLERKGEYAKLFEVQSRYYQEGREF